MVVVMKVLVFYQRELGEVIDKIRTTLEISGISYHFSQTFAVDRDYDYVIIIGEDRDVLKGFIEMGLNAIPVIGISITGSKGFLTSLSLDEFQKAIFSLKRGDFSIKKIDRLAVQTDKKHSYAINEIAIFPSKSATLMEYTLYVDGEFMWRDYSDGVIVSTPYGSTAYSMSAGGPIIHPNAKVFSIVSVNSVDPTRRPLIVPNSSRVELKDITGRFHPEIIVDGCLRTRVKGDVVIKKARKPALLIVFDKDELSEKMRRKIEFAKELQNLPPSAKLILTVLRYERRLSIKEIIRKTMLPRRTVSYAIKLLLEKRLIRESKVLLRDVREKIYEVVE